MIYLDSCILIYAVEDESSRGSTVRQRLAEAHSAEIAISHLVIMECLVGPLKSADLTLHDHYVRAFAQFRVLELGRDEFLRAAQLRARQGLKTPDALHLATVQLSGCEELWTNDERLAEAAGGLAVNVVR